MVDTIINYVKKTYNVEPEYPWGEAPLAFTLKDKIADKWFGLVMEIGRNKLGLDGDERVCILNIKADPDFIGMIVQSPGFFPAYHMNKKHWLTVILDGTVSENQIFDLIDESFRLITDSPTRRIYEAVKQIPKGKVATYGQVAKMAGDKKMARAVGNALHKNPDPDNIPCYRVVNAKGELAGEFAFGGEGAQARLLINDGIEVINGKVDLSKYGYSPTINMP